MSLDNGGWWYGGGVLIDLSKEDTLDHKLPIAKLFGYGFDKNALSLIKSYQSDRWQSKNKFFLQFLVRLIRRNASRVNIGSVDF